MPAPSWPVQGPAAPPPIPGVLAAVSPCPPLQKLGKAVAGPGAQLYINVRWGWAEDCTERLCCAGSRVLGCK